MPTEPDEATVEHDPWYIEHDEELPQIRTVDRWRIVAGSAYARRRAQGTSARPEYVATVYNQAHAREIADAHNERLRLATSPFPDASSPGTEPDEATMERVAQALQACEYRGGFGKPSWQDMARAALAALAGTPKEPTK